MIIFSRIGDTQLFSAPTSGDDHGALAYLFPEGVTPPQEDQPALALWNDYAGYFVFTPTLPENTEAFVEELYRQLSTVSHASLCWVDGDPEATFDALLLPIQSGSPPETVATDFSLRQLTLKIGRDQPIDLNADGDGFDITNVGERIQIVSDENPFQPVNVGQTVTLPMSGETRGAFSSLRVTLLPTQAGLRGFDLATYFFYPDEGGLEGAAAFRYPIFDLGTDNNGEKLELTGSLFPNAGGDSFFDFVTASQENLTSYYRTTTGYTLQMQPLGGSRLNFATRLGNVNKTLFYYLSPSGDYDLQVDATGDVAAATEPDLLCGLSGIEYIGFEAGDRLRFTAGQPAYAAEFPFTQSSPVGPPTDPLAKLLDSTFVTSWATVRRASGGDPHYVSQPKGSPLFGKDDSAAASGPGLLNPSDLGTSLPQTAGLSFPMPPYAGVEADGGTSVTMEVYESQVLAPSRRLEIGEPATTSPSRAASLNGRLAKAQESFNTTTPAGLLVGVECDGGACEWESILLGQNTQPALRKLEFLKPQAQLRQAFQTNQVFMVAANSVYLEGDGGSEFKNLMNIEDWILRADVGENRAYNDYSNIMIFKGRRGALYDPDGPSDENLIANPDQWTQRNELASPTVYDSQGNLQPPDIAQQVILSQWMQTYFEDAFAQTSPFFDNFKRIAKDPNWTGLMILKAEIDRVPDDLAGMLAGIDLDEFNAHHLGVEISPIDAETVTVTESSSIFGLIYYVDVAYDPEGEESGNPQPVPPPADAVYDFKVLTLQVLFRNTAVEDFKSVAQLTLNRFFAEDVDNMGDGGNRYNTIILRGSYQNNGGTAIYSLGSISDSTFYFDSNILNKIEVTNVQMSTRDPGTVSGTTRSWFSMRGFIDYKIVRQTVSGEGGEADDELLFDVFSFGNRDGRDDPRQGLSYNNLGILQTFPVADPTDVTYVFDTSEITFDLATSTPRADSLFINFALELQGLVEGVEDTTPASLGFAQLATDVRMTGVDGGPWFGLSYQLSMGTPGKLAGQVGLNSQLLTAWAPDSPADSESYRALVGLALPGTGGGAKLISLQTVLKLSIGLMRLLYDTKRRSFLLLLNEIALKFLGLLKIPPNGSTSFYLFGNPDSGGSPSGLGWYAVFKQKKEGDDSAAPRLLPSDTILALPTDSRRRVAR